MIWTEEQKTEMLRLREDEQMSNADIGQRFGVSGDRIRKVLVRFQKRSAEPEMAEAAARQEGGEIGRLAGNRPATLPERTDSLRRLHDEFDTKAPGRAESRPKWAGRPPLRITPKDFQK